MRPAHASARTEDAPSKMPAAVRGAALFVLEMLLVLYAVSIARGEWPIGHPWSGLGGLLFAVILWLGAANSLGLGVGLGALALCAFVVFGGIPFL